MSAEIIRFIPRPNRSSRLTEFLSQMRSAIRQDDLTMDHADTAACEYAVPDDDVTDAKDTH